MFEKKDSVVKLTTDITDLTDNYQEIIAARQGIRSIRTIRVRKKDSVVKPTTDETDLTDNSSQLTSSGSIRTIRVRKKKDSVVNLTTDQTDLTDSSSQVTVSVSIRVRKKVLAYIIIRRKTNKW